MNTLKESKKIFRKLFLSPNNRSAKASKYQIEIEFYDCNKKRKLLYFIEADLLTDLLFKINHFKDLYNETNSEYYNRIATIDLGNNLKAIKNWLNENKEQLDAFRKTNKFNSKGQTPKKKTSYCWLTFPDKELPELFKLMINQYSLIVPETSYDEFKDIFTAQPIESIKPIKWHEDNASELLYFINRLEKSHNIKHNVNRADYQKLKACFVKPNGKVFNEAFKSLKTNIEIALSADKRKIIDDLINRF